MIRAEVIADSIGVHAPRLHTQRWTHPTFNHQEVLRHRKLCIHDQLAMTWEPDFSFSVSSSRAIPFAKLLEEVRSDELRAEPVSWGAAQRGMSPGDEVPDDDNFEGLGISSRQAARNAWREAALCAADIAESLAATGVHKTYPNRIIAPFVHTHCLVTSTAPGWLNFFGLRLDKAADPTVRALARAAWAGWCESEPRRFEPGHWHLPYIDDQDWERAWIIAGTKNDNGVRLTTDIQINLLCKISVARCARLSYASFETGKRSTLEEDIALYDRLLGSMPIHASPAEHQATPDEFIQSWHDNYGPDMAWRYREQAGNLGYGWRQYRKMIPGEAVAPLPKEYQ